MDLKNTDIKGKGIEVYRKGRELSDKFDTLNKERADAGWFYTLLAVFIVAVMVIMPSSSLTIGEVEITKLNIMMFGIVFVFIMHRKNVRDNEVKDEF